MLTRRSGLIGAASVVVATIGGVTHTWARSAVRSHREKELVPASARSPADTPLGPVDTAARWAYGMDWDTGVSLLEKRADEQMPPSSMTKLMTIYIVYDRLKAGRLKLDDALLVSERAWRMQGSKMFVQVGTSVKVEDLIRGVIVQSGNDAALVLAEAIGGSEEGFVDLMNTKAKEIGLTNSTFRNCTGWPDPAHHMSVRDIAILAARIIQDFPEYYHYDAEKSFEYNGIDQPNRNPMVQRGTADGLKTGHTEAGGFGLVVSSKRNGRRVILVLNGMNSMHERGGESERLMDWLFANFEDVTLYSAGVPVENAAVWLGDRPTVPLVSENDLRVTMPRNWRQKASVKVSYDAPLTAPIQKGDNVGRLVLSGEGVPNFSVPLVAGDDVNRLGLPGRAIAVVSRYITGT
jgi:serine-type D-Ala-D-Ala carboxypeptidase (penicillin-binding protein 5/6)